ncbi:hypothetical protein [Glutamicibacter creatinolyticus]|uniref:hypothetical protein n=1 Tax=Glutamicibacter creatinolyticus TaxID=162496 RepID=UPI001110A85C|nr:hypothetical protein [Glutamicibacter creatinolyticus]
MTIQAWVEEKLSKSEIDTESNGDNGILTICEGRARLIVVAEPGPSPLGFDELDAILDTYPTCEAIVLIRRFPDNGVFEAARARGVLLDTFGKVLKALKLQTPLHEFQDNDESYLRSRLIRHGKVSDIVRIGLAAWRIERLGLRDLIVITHDRYEFPVDELYERLDAHPNLEPDAFIITNPNTNGLSTRVTAAAMETGVEIHLLKAIFTRLNED